MPKIRFTKSRPDLDVESGANLMKALLAGGLPVASSCRGDGVCAKCRIEIVLAEQMTGPAAARSAALSTEGETESFLRERHSIPSNMRVSCQVAVLGDITVNASYW